MTAFFPTENTEVNRIKFEAFRQIIESIGELSSEERATVLNAVTAFFGMPWYIIPDRK
jgi:hypothetical protein